MEGERGEGEKEMVQNLRKTPPPRHQMAVYGLVVRQKI